MFVRVLFLTLLLSLPVQARAAGYVVQPGDTLGAIAQHHGVSVATLARANAISNVNLIRAGTVLLIPVQVRRVAAHYLWYRVQWGDTLLGLSGHYGIYVSTIRSLNPRLGAYPLAGEWLRLCSPCAPYSIAVSRPGPVASNQTATGVANLYVVRPGDSLIAIANHFGTTVGALLAVNRVLDPNLITIGSRLALPAGYTGPVAPTYDPWAARSLIATYARQYGFDPALALAVSWQESGFNQSVVSSTGAIGVMQVEPYTGAHIAGLLGRPINLYLLDDNVQAGVYWLSTLLQYYGGNTRFAVAAYYQGTRSIARHGFYGDTVQYVRNVLALQVQFGS